MGSHHEGDVLEAEVGDERMVPTIILVPMDGDGCPNPGITEGELLPSQAIIQRRAEIPTAPCRDLSVSYRQQREQEVMDPWPLIHLEQGMRLLMP